MSVLTAAITGKLRSLTSRPDVREALAVMREREYMFKSPLGMKLTAIALIPSARESLETFMDNEWSADNIAYSFSRRFGEVIIGGGIHAAIYAAGRVAKGYVPPIVIERDRPGGIFATSKRPSFYLNSNNRPGKLALPGDNLAALNYIPGAPIQPSFVSSREYQTNADLAFVTRLTLALTANVKIGNVTDVAFDRFTDSYPFTLTTATGYEIRARRVIDARGLGDARNASDSDGRLVQTYPEFLASLDTVCPLRGLERVAVIGGGDSGKTAVEALLGIGPDAMMTVTGLDYVRSIDWYAKELPTSCTSWRDQIRGRYQRIGSYLPKPDRPGNRLTVINQRAAYSKALDAVIVNGQSYDRVILATGFTLDNIRSSGFDSFDTEAVGRNNPIGRKYSGEYYAIGPAAQLDFTSAEFQRGYAGIDANQVAIFRTANRTSALATMLVRVAS